MSQKISAMFGAKKGKGSTNTMICTNLRGITYKVLDLWYHLWKQHPSIISNCNHYLIKQLFNQTNIKKFYLF